MKRKSLGLDEGMDLNTTRNGKIVYSCSKCGYMPRKDKLDKLPWRGYGRVQGMKKIIRDHLEAKHGA